MLSELAIASPIVTKALFEPSCRESTTREEIYPWLPRTKLVVREETVAVSDKNEDREDTYPAVPSPVTVLASLLVK